MNKICLITHKSIYFINTLYFSLISINSLYFSLSSQYLCLVPFENMSFSISRITIAYLCLFNSELLSGVKIRLLYPCMFGSYLSFVHYFTIYFYGHVFFCMIIKYIVWYLTNKKKKEKKNKFFLHMWSFAFSF